MSKNRSCSRSIRKALQASAAAALSTFALGGWSAHAANYTWDGNPSIGTGNSKWSYANNWGIPDAANVAPPIGAAGLTNSDVFFAGALKTTPQMDNPYSIRTLTFNSGASSFTLGSQQNPPNAETLTIGTGGIINNSVNTQAINSPLVLGAAQTWNASSGGLQIGGAVALGANNLAVGGASNTTIAGTIGGSGGLAKTGNGTLTLTASNSFTGGMTVSYGTLEVNNTLGSATGPNAVAVSPGAILTGAGIINGPVTVNGILSPGNSPGILRINNDLTLGPASSTLLELGGPGAGQYDRVIGVAKLTLDGVITVSRINGFNPSPGDTFDLFDYSLIDSSNFDPETDLILPTLMNGWGWDRSSFPINGQISTVIPEPAAITLFGLGVLMWLCLSAKRKS
jgi:autotransporter-associated beta strand protein